VLRAPLEDSGRDVSPPTQWRHTMMAQSLNDPYYLANVEEETHTFPELAGLIEDICLTCHAPMARTHAHQTGVNLDASGHYRLDVALEEDIAREGGSCSSCHQITDDGGLGETTFSGQFTISATDRVIYGQYQNPVAGPMVRFSGYAPSYGAHMADSGHCATCHVLFTPTLDADTHQPTGEEFLEQGVYFEWENSVYATGREKEQQCQDCHMPDPEPGSYATRLAVRPDGTVNTSWPQRGPVPAFHEHTMIGANSHMLSILRDFSDVMGIESSTSTAGFDAQIDATRDFLRTAADLEVTTAAVVDGTLEIDLAVINRSGHKLPTSFPSRRVWVNLRVTDGSGNVVFDSGSPDSRGRISSDGAALTTECLADNKPADFNSAACFEPHRDVIRDDAQVAIYEPVLGDTNGNITYVLLKAARYIKDNRVPPEGFTIAAQHPDTANIGTGGDADFNANAAGMDTVHYRIALNGRTGPFGIDARLLYQTVRPAFAEALHFEGQHIARFKAMLEEHPPLVEQLAIVNLDIE
jgi:ferredoxin